MATLLLTISLFGLVMTGMAIGVIVKNRPIKGSCGGMAALKIGTACDICGGDMSKCDEQDGPDRLDKQGRLDKALRASNDGSDKQVKDKAQWHEAQ